VARAASPRVSATVATTITAITGITATATISVSQPASPSLQCLGLQRHGQRAGTRVQLGRAQRPELVADVADRDEERSAEGKHDGGIGLHRRQPPVAFDKSVGKCIAKGGGTGCGDLFE
jgi:hypothetical protein